MTAGHAAPPPPHAAGREDADRRTTRVDADGPGGSGDGVAGQVPVGDPAGVEPDVDAGTAADAGPDAGPEAVAPLSEVASLELERDGYLRSLQQLQADFENYRKRVIRQQEEQSTRGVLELVRKILPVLDTLDLAEAHLAPDAGSEAPAEVRALTQVRSQLFDVLGSEGLERVDAAETVFDPVVHDAVAHLPHPEDAATGGADGGAATGDDAAGDRGPGGVGGGAGNGAPSAGPRETVVDEVLRSGYRWRGQVLRPAMVRVRG